MEGNGDRGIIIHYSLWLSSSYLFTSWCDCIRTNVSFLNHHPPFRAEIPEVDGDLENNDSLNSCQVE